jgi:hypothetical protein
MLRWDRPSTDDERLTMIREPRTDLSVRPEKDWEWKGRTELLHSLGQFSPKRNEQKGLLSPARLHWVYQYKYKSRSRDDNIFVSVSKIEHTHRVSPWPFGLLWRPNIHNGHWDTALRGSLAPLCFSSYLENRFLADGSVQQCSSSSVFPTGLVP